MTELMMRFRGRDISIHTSPEGLGRVAELLVELSQRAEREQASDREVARMSGMTIAQYDADVTAPDPG